MLTNRIVIAALLAAACLFTSTAWADEETFLTCLRDCDCGSFNCVIVDIDCNCTCEGATGPLRVEFLDSDGNVLGAGEVAPDWCGRGCEKRCNECDKCEDRCNKCDKCGGNKCNGGCDECNRGCNKCDKCGESKCGRGGCDGEMTFTLDNAVNVQDVCSIRLVKSDGDPSSLWLSIKVGLKNECDCDMDWCTLWKGDLCEWSPVAEVMAPPPPAPEPEPMPAPAPPRPAPPAPRPEPRYVPPPPAPEPEPIPIVPGNG